MVQLSVKCSVRHWLLDRSASTATIRHRRGEMRSVHLRAAEAAFAVCANSMDSQLGRTPEGKVTLDFDSTGVEVYGRNRPGAAVNYQGRLAYQPLLCSWAQRGRLLASELLAGSGGRAQSGARPGAGRGGDRSRAVALGGRRAARGWSAG